MAVHAAALAEPGEEARVIAGRVEVQHHAAAHEGGGQLALLVGGDDDEREPAAFGAHLEMAERRHREAAVAENIEQGIGHLGVGLVDLVDQEHRLALARLVDGLPQAPALHVFFVGGIEPPRDLSLIHI